MLIPTTHKFPYLIAAIFLSFFCVANAHSKPLPAPMTGAIILKLMALEAEADIPKKLNILVLNDPNLAKYLRTKIGAKMGQGQLEKVWLDSAPNGAKPHIIYINSNKQVSETVAYARSIHALTISNDVARAKDGIVLFIYDDEGLPGIALNIPASKAMGYRWSPKILEISAALY